MPVFLSVESTEFAIFVAETVLYEPNQLFINPERRSFNINLSSSNFLRVHSSIQPRYEMPWSRHKMQTPFLSWDRLGMRRQGAFPQRKC